MREQWPDSPIMFRPVSYLYKKGLPSTNHFLKGATTSDIDYINESVYRVGQSIRYLTEHQQEPDRMPIFRWSDKLIGSNQYGKKVIAAWKFCAYLVSMSQTLTLIPNLGPRRGSHAFRLGIVPTVALRRDDALLPQVLFDA